jgi:hypothetical protein
MWARAYPNGQGYIQGAGAYPNKQFTQVETLSGQHWMDWSIACN